MTQFLKKIEGHLQEVHAYVRKDGTVVEKRRDNVVHKPSKPKKAKNFTKRKSSIVAPVKPSKPTKPRKAQRFDGPATAAKTVSKLKQTNFMHVRTAIADFEKFLQVADPFNIQDATWGQFFIQAAPRIMVMMLWDLGHVMEQKDRAYLLRYFKQRIKT